MKPTIEAFYKQGFIKFNDLLLKNYLTLRLDESDVVLLMLLHEVELNGSNFLSVSDISNLTTMEVDIVADKIDLLVTKGFISLDIVDKDGFAEEKFSVASTLDKLLVEEKEVSEPDRKVYVEFLENELNRPLSSKELQIINTWNYTIDELKAALLAAIKQKKMGVEYVNKILLNNKSEVKKDMTYFNQFLND